MVYSFFKWFPVFFVPSHWNGVNTLTGSFSMILSFELRMIIWLQTKKKTKQKNDFLDGTLFLYMVPCVFWFHCIKIVSVPSQVPFPWFDNLKT